jgi:hypothetical protein
MPKKQLQMLFEISVAEMEAPRDPRIVGEGFRSLGDVAQQSTKGDKHG